MPDQGKSRFEEARERLQTLDRVLNEELLKRHSSAQDGIDAIKKSGEVGKYIVLEVTLKGDGKAYSQTYLRGFERMYVNSSAIPYNFLGELRCLMKAYFDLSAQWTYEHEKNAPAREFGVEKDGLKLDINALTGGRYRLADNYIEVFGLSGSFQPDATRLSEYEDKLKGLLGLLAQKEQYREFKVNMENVHKVKLS